MNKTIQKVISECRTQQKLAELCRVKQPTVNKWLNGGGIKGKYISLIAKASNGKVTESEILQSLSEN